MVLQRYLTDLILTYARKYIRNIQANINLSLWGNNTAYTLLHLHLHAALLCCSLLPLLLSTCAVPHTLAVLCCTMFVSPLPCMLRWRCGA